MSAKQKDKRSEVQAGTDVLGAQLTRVQRLVHGLAHLVGLDSYVSGSVDFSSIRNPTSHGIFGGDIPDKDLLFSVKREPAAHRIVFGVAQDVLDKWFYLEPVGDEKVENPAQEKILDDEVQKELTRLNAKQRFIKLLAFERLFGWSVMLIGYADSAETLRQPIDNPVDIQDLAVYSPLEVSNIVEVTNSTDERFGYPDIYKISTGTGTPVDVHYSRVIHCATRLIDHLYKGLSVLYPVYDDLLGFRYLRWGVYMTMIRYGSGFPDVELTGADLKQIDAFIASGQFDNLNAQKYFVHNESQKFEFKGMGSNTLNPMNYYQIALESISLGSGIPEPILRGAQAGTLTGSEVNERSYFKMVSDIQTAIEPFIRLLIDKILMFKRNLTAEELPKYRLVWTAGYEPTQAEKADVDYKEAATAEKLLLFETVDEVRATYDLEPLPNGEGAKLAQKSAGGASPSIAASGSVASPSINADKVAHDQVETENLTKKLQTGLQTLVREFLSSKMTMDEAVFAAGVLIEAHITSMKKIAKQSIEAKLGRPIGELSPENQAQFVAQINQLLGDFKRILKDAQRGGNSSGSS